MMIAIEGPDGCGKDTIAELVATATQGRIFRFPDDNTVTGPLIRAYLAKKWRMQGNGERRGRVFGNQPGPVSAQCLL